MTVYNLKYICQMDVIGYHQQQKIQSPIFRPVDWDHFFFLANRAPADWAPWRQIGPLGNFVAANWAPENFEGGKLGPGNFVGGKSGPGRLGPLAANWAPTNGAPGKFGRGKLGPIMIFRCFWSLHNCLLCNSCHAILC